MVAVEFGQGQGTAWLRSVGKEVCEPASRIAELVDWLFNGIYHIQEEVVRADWSRPLYVELRLRLDLATFDSDLLTRLVVGAHDRAIRVSIGPFGPKSVQLLFHPRTGRDGRIFERHPKMEEALEQMQRMEVL